jgi:hypothetical protein
MTSTTNQFETDWQYYWFKTIVLANLDFETTEFASAFIWINITSNPNTTIELVEHHIKLPWRWDIVCSSLIKSIDFVERNPTAPINWGSLSLNPNITLDIIDNNIGHPWDWDTISSREDVTIEFYKKHENKPWNMKNLSELANLWEDISINTSKYCVFMATYNPRITLEFIERHLDIYLKHDWYISKILTMKIVTLEFIEKHINKFDDYIYKLSSNPNLTLEFMKNHPKNWNMSRFSTVVAPEIVANNPSIQWDWQKLSARPEFSPKEYPNTWHWHAYSCNPNFDFDNVPDDKLSDLDWLHISRWLKIPDIEKYLKYISWSHMSISAYITMDFIRKNPQYPWVFSSIKNNNPNCDIELHKLHVPNSYDRMKQHFKADKEAFIERRRREFTALMCMWKLGYPNEIIHEIYAWLNVNTYA